MVNKTNQGATDSIKEKGFLADAPVDEHERDLYPLDGDAHRIDTLEAVDDDAIRFFHEYGYLAVDSGRSDEEVEGCQQGINDLIDGKYEGFRSVMVEAGAREAYPNMDVEERRSVVRKVFNFVDVEPRLTSLTTHSGILDVVRRLMGGIEPRMLQDMALLKPARIGREKAWHQDMAYFDVPIETTVVGVWIALDAATLKNGCLHVVPGSHKAGPHPHFKVRDWQICDTVVRTEGSLPVPLQPGGFLFWHGLTHHGSPSNRSDQGRRGIQLHYQPENTVKTSKDTRLAVYGGEGLGMTC